ncbi:MAG: hypothetical protein GY795_18595 [Desulfobacterales bacterium]|nr:hypothetical protein [Desulfobacterales bacterium]
MSFREKSKNINTAVALLVFGFTVVFYATLFLIHKDAFRESNDWLFLPYKRLFLDLDNSITINDVIRNKEQEKNSNSQQYQKNYPQVPMGILYVFVLDISDSINKKIKKPNWFDKTVRRLVKDGYLDSDKRWDNIPDEINIFDVARVRLCQLLVELISENSMDCFSIWTVGNFGKKIYPNPENISNSMTHTRFAPVDELYIINAIKGIDTQYQLEKSTDFKDLFDKIVKKYKNNIDISNSKVPSLVITILSDMLHDVKDKSEYGDSEELIKNWNELEKKIEELSNRNIMANMIILTKGGEIILHEQHLQIFPVFEKYLDWYRLKKRAISENVTRLFPVVFAENSIIFYYESEDKEGIHDVDLLVTQDDYDMIIDIPSEINYNEQKGLKLKYSILGREDTLRKPGRITSNGSCLREKLKKNQKIRLSCNNPVPKIKMNSLKLRINIAKERRTYLVDINFIKLLPYELAILFVILQSVCIISSILGLLVLFCRFFIKSEKDMIVIDPKTLKTVITNNNFDDDNFGDINFDNIINRHQIEDKSKLVKLLQVISSKKLLQLLKRTDILGVWSGGSEILEFQEDGTVVKYIGNVSMKGKYITDGDRIFIKDLVGFNSEMNYHVKDDILKISDEQGLVYTYLRL